VAHLFDVSTQELFAREQLAQVPLVLDPCRPVVREDDIRRGQLVPNKVSAHSRTRAGAGRDGRG
jgi:hypothetical protein